MEKLKARVEQWAVRLIELSKEKDEAKYLKQVFEMGIFLKEAVKEYEHELKDINTDI